MSSKREPESPDEIAEARIQAALGEQAGGLELYELGLTSLPESLGKLSTLQELYLQWNQLTSLPESLGKLSGLQILNLHRNQLTSLPESLGKLRGLQRLILSGNQLTSLPESLGKLSALQELQLFHNQLTSLPESLGKLRGLQTLILSGNQLTSLPESLGKLSALQTLGLSHNQLTSLPESLGKLSGLEWLDLSDNQLTSLPESLGKLSGLQSLYLSGNQLTSLPAGIRELRALTHLFLHDNPALGLPLEVLGPTFDGVTGGAREKPAAPAAILDYYFRARASARPLNEGKVILVGRGEVGKTSLVNRLTKNEFNEGEDKTQGIQISQWEVRAGADDVRLNVWDFGGQEIMHATHQFFLTERSLYLLVLNGREGAEDQDAEYWLKLIGSFGSESPVIVVLNKIDQHPFDLNYRALQLRYPQVHGFVRTDCKTEAGIEELRQRIQSEIDALPGVRAMFPGTWFAIKDKLAAMKENFLSYEKFRELCRANNETDEKAQDDLAGFLHCLGIALNYKDDLRLRDTSVLNPHWVTTGIYKLLNAGKLAEHKGVMCMSDLEAWLPAQDYPREKHPFILELMRRFRLCFAFPDDGQNRYLVPELLDKQEPDLQGEFSPKECLNFEYHYGILPEGLLPQFIVRSHILISGTLRWRSGVVLQWEDCRALVKGDMAEKRVVIRVRGGAAEARRRLLAVIRSDFERIHGEIARLEVTAQVPLPDHPEVLKDYDELLTFDRDGVKEIPVKAGGRTVLVKVSDLLNGVDLEVSRHKADTLGMQKHAFRLFYSYSHKDESLRDELDTHLKLLQREGLISTWHDRRILGGEDWANRIDESLEAADFILLLASADFIASDYCYEKEMTRAIQRHKKREAVVVPVIVRDCDWQSAKFGQLQALPKNGTAVKLWPDRDSAWKDIAQGIRRLVQERREQLEASRLGDGR